MTGLFIALRRFRRPSQMLMVNQFAMNIGFSMLMPYLADYLADDLRYAGWVVGLIIGTRNLCQQGMFWAGGALADRLGYKQLIVAGCLLRTAGFGLLVFAHALPELLISSVTIGFAGALFAPAVPAYIAADSADNRVEAFAVLNIFQQAGFLIGPILGLGLIAFDFRMTAASAAAVFGILAIAQIRWLPQNCDKAEGRIPLSEWRKVLENRPFLILSASMAGCAVLSFQVFLALPMQASRIVGTDSAAGVMMVVFVVSGLLSIVAQLPITRWVRERWHPRKILVAGMIIIAAAYIPLMVNPDATLGTATAIGTIVVVGAVLSVGASIVQPFALDSVVALSKDRLVASHFGMYNTIGGIGIMLGNLGTGAAMDTARIANMSSLVWLVLAVIGLASTVGLYTLGRTGLLDGSPSSVAAA